MSVILALDCAQADQISPPATHTGAIVSCGLHCAHFQGYVVVRRHEASPQAVARPDAVLSANRLYLPSDDDNTLQR